MAYHQSYRPQTFGELRGQDAVSLTLLSALRQGKLAPAYLFTGPRGTGKTTTARLLAKSANCEDLQPNGEPCGTCRACVAFAAGKMIDVVEFDAASHTGVDDARELIERAAFAPALFARKVYIIDEAHMLSKAAWNALLKTLEEPPARVHFIFCTTEADKILPTIRSRCQSFAFSRIADDEILSKLEKICAAEGREADGEALKLVAREAAGGMRDAEVLLEKLLTETDGTLDVRTVERSLGLVGETVLGDFLAALRARDRSGLISQIRTLEGRGQDFRPFLRAVLTRLRDELLTSTNPAGALRWIELLSLAADQLRSALIPTLPLEVAVARGCEEGSGFRSRVSGAEGKQVNQSSGEPREAAGVSGSSDISGGQQSAPTGDPGNSSAGKSPSPSGRGSREAGGEGSGMSAESSGSPENGTPLPQGESVGAMSQAITRNHETTKPHASNEALRDALIAAAPTGVKAALRGARLDISGDSAVLRIGSERMAAMIGAAIGVLEPALRAASGCEKLNLRVERSETILGAAPPPSSPPSSSPDQGSTSAPGLGAPRRNAAEELLDSVGL